MAQATQFKLRLSDAGIDGLRQRLRQDEYALDQIRRSNNYAPADRNGASRGSETSILEADRSKVQNILNALAQGKPIEALSSDDDGSLERAVTALHKGNLAYVTPEKMKTGQTAHVVARIGSDKVSISTLQAGMSTDQGTKTAIASTPVSARMKMTLKSADFDVTPLSSEEQFIAGDVPTAWQWDIAPRHSGKLRLHLAAVVELNGLSRDFTTIDRDIAVQVDTIDEAEKFARANAVWMLGGLGTGLAALWAWMRKRKKPRPSGWETP